MLKVPQTLQQQKCYRSLSGGSVVADHETTPQASEQHQALRPWQVTKVASPRHGDPEWSTGHEGQHVLGRKPCAG